MKVCELKDQHGKWNIGAAATITKTITIQYCEQVCGSAYYQEKRKVLHIEYMTKRDHSIPSIAGEGKSESLHLVDSIIALAFFLSSSFFFVLEVK